MPPVFTTAIVERILRAWQAANGEIQSGCTAWFIKVNDEWGFKFYPSRHWTELMVLRQMYAFEHGLGPDCDTTIHAFVLNECYKRNRYGYFTHLVDEPQLPDIMSPDRNIYLDMFRSFCDSLRERGPAWNSLLLDMHPGLNWGWYRGRQVAYDFSAWLEAPEGLDDRTFVAAYPGERPYGDNVYWDW